MSRKRTVNVCVERLKNESFEALLSRFRKTVEREGVLKDHKMNSLMSRTERNKFKEFASSRRSKKKQKRVTNAITNRGVL